MTEERLPVPNEANSIYAADLTPERTVGMPLMTGYWNRRQACRTRLGVHGVGLTVIVFPECLHCRGGSEALPLSQ